MSYYETWAQEYYIEEYDRMSATIGRLLRRHNDQRIDEIMSDVVLVRLPDLLRTWDPNKAASLDVHVTIGIKWWAFKDLVKKDKAREIESPWSDRDTDSSTDGTNFVETLMTSEQIKLLESVLTRPQLLVLRRRYVEGMTIREMSDKACVSRGLIYARLNEAMAIAKHTLTYGHLYSAVCNALQELIDESS